MDLYTPNIGISFDADQFSVELDALLLRDAKLQHAHAEHSTHFAPTAVHCFVVENGTIETVANYWLLKSIQSHPQLLLFCMKLPAQQLLWLLRNRLIQLYKEETLRIRKSQIDLWIEWGKQNLYLSSQQKFIPNIFGYRDIQEHVLSSVDRHEKMAKLLPNIAHFQYPSTISQPIQETELQDLTRWISDQQILESKWNVISEKLARLQSPYREQHPFNEQTIEEAERWLPKQQRWESRWNTISAELTRLQSPYVEERPFNKSTIEEAEDWLPKQRRLVDEVSTLKEALHPFDVSVSLNAPYADTELEPYRSQLKYWTQRFAKFDRADKV